MTTVDRHINSQQSGDNDAKRLWGFAFVNQLGTRDRPLSDIIALIRGIHHRPLRLRCILSGPSTPTLSGTSFGRWRTTTQRASEERILVKSSKSKMRLSATVPLIVFLLADADGFTSQGSTYVGRDTKMRFSAPLLGEATYSTGGSSFTTFGSTSNGETPTLSPAEQKKKERMELVRKEGGRFAFNTKYGALNPYGIYYGLIAIILGIPWFFELMACQLMYTITRNRFDKFTRIPLFFSHLWGVLLLRLTRNYPKMENLDVLHKFYSEKRPAMFVANHVSWMDIPFIGATIGWRNYKLVSKQELGKVPILGRAIKVSGHVMLDRSDHKSQLRTLKKGIQYLKVSGCRDLSSIQKSKTGL